MFYWISIFVIAGLNFTTAKPPLLPHDQEGGVANFQHLDDDEDNSRDNIIDVDAKALDVQDDLIANGVLQDDGRVCFQKVSMTEETKYEEMMVCDHKSEERCHDTYITVYVPHQVFKVHCIRRSKIECIPGKGRGI